MPDEEHLIRIDRIIESLQSDIPNLTDIVKKSHMIVDRVQSKLKEIDIVLKQVSSLYEDQKSDSVSASKIFEDLKSKKTQLEEEISSLSLKVNEESKKIENFEGTLETFGREKRDVIIEQEEKSVKAIEELRTKIIDEIDLAKKTIVFNESELEEKFKTASDTVDERISQRVETLSGEVDRRVNDACELLESRAKEITQQMEVFSAKEKEYLTQKYKETTDSLKIYMNEVRESFTNIVKETSAFRIEQAINDFKNSSEKRVSEAISNTAAEVKSLSQEFEKDLQMKLNELDDNVSLLRKMNAEVPQLIESNIKKWLNDKSEELVLRIVRILKV